MSYNTLTIQPDAGQHVQPPTSQHVPLPLLAMLAFSLHTIERSRRDLNKFKRRYMWTAFKIRCRDFWKQLLDR